jgi:thiol:disulfide interchange protein DsbC
MANKAVRYTILAGLISILTPVFMLQFPPGSYAFSGCEENCEKCHTLSEQEVRLIFEKLKVQDAKIIRTQMSPVKGLWEIAIEEKGQRGLFYVDFSKKFVVTGSIVEVNAAINKTKERLDELNKDKRISPASIPLKDALVLGSNAAAKKVIVFTDPDCPYCAKLHQEMKKVVAQRMDIAFHIKLLPLKTHPDSHWKSKSILCSKSLQLLEDNFEKKPIPKSDCASASAELEKTAAFANKNGISGTPTVILPDGSVYQGSADADKLIKMIDDAASKAGKKKK